MKLKKLTDHNHDKYITTPDFNTQAADDFNARLAQANLETKRNFDAKLWSLNGKITSNKEQSTYLLKTNWKSWKHLVQFILEVKVTLKKMAHKII